MKHYAALAPLIVLATGCSSVQTEQAEILVVATGTTTCTAPAWLWVLSIIVFIFWLCVLAWFITRQIRRRR